MKKILLLGGSAQQVIAVKRAKEMGYQTVLCDFLLDNPGQFSADRFYLISTTDREAILNVAVKEKIDGILAYASDPAAPTAAYVASRLNLPGNPFEAVEILCNKSKFRTFLRKNKFNAPKAMEFESQKSAMEARYSFSYPLIIKPVDSSGSKGVTVLHSEEGLKEAISFAFSFSRYHKILIEDYIEKKHPYLIGGDIFIVDGEVFLWGLLNCHRDFRVNPLVPVGKSYPLQLEYDSIEKVKDTLTKIVKRLGIQNGSMNVELVVDKNNQVWPIDIGPRAGGNMIPDLLGDIFGVDIVKMSIQAAMGEEITCEMKKSDGLYATYNLHSDKNGIYRNMVFSSEIEPYIYRRCLYKKEGDRIEYFDNASKCLGIIFLKFKNKEDKEMILKEMNKYIQIQLSED